MRKDGKSTHWIRTLVLLGCCATPVHAKDDGHDIGLPSKDAPGREVLTANVLGCSAISDLIRANGGKIPHSLGDLVRVLGENGTEGGGVLRAFIPFTQAPVPSSLAKPRVLLTAGGQFGRASERKPRPKHLNLEKRLFTALSTAADGSQKLEFISWNRSRKDFDFGEVEHFGTSKAKLVSHPAQTRQCMTCHQSGGPIFAESPWSSTTDGHAATALAMVKKQAQENPERYSGIASAVEGARKGPSPKERQRLETLLSRSLSPTQAFEAAVKESPVLSKARFHLNGEDSGLPLFDFDQVSNLSTDFSVGMAHVHLQLHQSIAAIPESERLPFVRAATKTLASSVLSDDGTPGGSEEAYRKGIETLVYPAMKKIPSSTPHIVINISPSTGAEISASKGADETDPTPDNLKQLLSYDGKRGDGLTTTKPRLTSDIAFREREKPTASNVQDIYGTEFSPSFGLTGVLGISEADRKFLLSLLPPEDRKATLLRILASPRLNKLAESGRLPTREQLVRTLAEIVVEERGEKLPEGALKYLENLPEEDDCANAPLGAEKPAPHGGSCSSCHVGEKAIMPFEFDPADQAAWAKALKAGSAEDKKKTRVLLTKTIQRLEDAQSPMPPKRSPEEATFSAESKQALLKFLKNL